MFKSKIILRGSLLGSVKASIFIILFEAEPRSLLSFDELEVGVCRPISYEIGLGSDDGCIIMLAY